MKIETPMTDRCSKMIETKTGDDKKAYSYRLLDASDQPIASNKKGQSQSGGATRYASITAAVKAADAYAARTGEPATIDLAVTGGARGFMTLTQQIIADAKALGLTRVEIAAICGVRLATVTDWGHGRIDPLANIGPLLLELDRVAARAAKKQKG